MYKYIKAIVDVKTGELVWEYQLEGSAVVGRMRHDEPVDGYTERDIIDLTCKMLDAEDQRNIVTVEYR